MYVLVMEAEGFEILVDPELLWLAPRVTVRRKHQRGEVWLDENDVSFTRPPTFDEQDQARVLALVERHIDELGMWWVSLKDDVRKERLERNNNVMVD